LWPKEVAEARATAFGKVPRDVRSKIATIVIVNPQFHLTDVAPFCCGSTRNVIATIPTGVEVSLIELVLWLSPDLTRMTSDVLANFVDQGAGYLPGAKCVEVTVNWVLISIINNPIDSIAWGISSCTLDVLT